MWGVTSTNGDDGLMKATLETVDGSRIGRFLTYVAWAFDICLLK